MLSNIVSVEQAKQWYEKGSVVFTDCRFALGKPEEGYQKYQRGHLPGAVYFDLEKSLSSNVKEHGGRHPLPKLEDFERTLTDAGIDKETIVIAYDQNRSAMSARLLWLLKFCGHEHVYLLNGGLDTWQERGFSLHKGDEDVTPVSPYHCDIHSEMACDEAYVKSERHKEGTTLIDSRSYPRFAGWEEPIDKKKGHIPGALQYSWVDVYKEEGTWKSKRELTSHFRGLTPSNEIIVYCGSGVTAASNVVGLWEAGFSNVKLYVGSFSDWISYPENEVATVDN